MFFTSLRIDYKYLYAHQSSQHSKILANTYRAAQSKTDSVKHKDSLSYTVKKQFSVRRLQCKTEPSLC